MITWCGGLRAASRLVLVQFMDPVYRDEAMTVGVRWEATGVTGGLFPVLDAEIRLSGTGSRGSRVMLTASYRPPLGAAGAGFDRLLLHTVATRHYQDVSGACDQRRGGHL